jgi:hypothetical protein
VFKGGREGRGGEEREAGIREGHFGVTTHVPTQPMLTSLTCVKHHTFLSHQALTLIARAHHDANEYMEARQALLRGLHQFPTDMKLRFNLAFVLQVRVRGAGCACVL